MILLVLCMYGYGVHSLPPHPLFVPSSRSSRFFWYTAVDRKLGRFQKLSQRVSKPSGLNIFAVD